MRGTFSILWIGLALVCLSSPVLAQEPGAGPSASPDRKPLRVRVSEGVARGLLVKKIAPEYPEEARNRHVEGDVVLKVMISTSGDVKDASPLSGDELLVPSAVAAVKQWKFKPYLLNGTPVEVETKITINYALTR